MFPLSKGKVAKQAHVGLPEGTFEEEHGREAFDGRVSHLYRTHPPTAWVRIEGPLRPRAYDGDVCYFVHRGSGQLESDYGPLRYREGDFVVLPKGTTHRMVPDEGET